ncbi:MAG: glycosyl hydrolase family 8 [Defluviitaleaceae bacterium]|nr:glycosyl hydrolase family 8 [Defluviitaleaceae bacterium]
MAERKYRNLFAENGYTNSEIEKRVGEIVHTIFYDENEKFYVEEGELAYFTDTGNNDVRTEGMSYAMMMFVQMDMKEQFDRIWRWTMKYMYQHEGDNRGYFAWSVKTNGVRNAQGPAPDGEEYFAMALFFASNRWGDGEGIFNYSKCARDLLRDCLHNPKPMWNPQNKLIKFVPNMEITDPSYHLPHFYELFALWANEEDRAFWKEAAKASRAFLKTTLHPITGLAPEYANYDGTPHVGIRHHHLFYSDSYRVAANLGLSHEWFPTDGWECEAADKIQKFFFETVKGEENFALEIDGTPTDLPILHPVGLLATNAAASLAAKGKFKEYAVKKFWETPLATGDRRYYDNCLYLFAFLALSGNYKIISE